MRLSLLSLMLLLALPVWAADIPDFQRVFTVTDVGVLIVIDYDNNGTADEANDVALINTGSAAVVCSMSRTMPVYSSTDKFPISAGQARHLSREWHGPYYTHVSCITSAGTSTTLGIYAQR